MVSGYNYFVFICLDDSVWCMFCGEVVYDISGLNFNILVGNGGLGYRLWIKCLDVVFYLLGIIMLVNKGFFFWEFFSVGGVCIILWVWCKWC